MEKGSKRYARQVLHGALLRLSVWVGQGGGVRCTLSHRSAPCTAQFARAFEARPLIMRPRPAFVLASCAPRSLLDVAAHDGGRACLRASFQFQGSRLPPRSSTHATSITACRHKTRTSTVTFTPPVALASRGGVPLQRAPPLAAPGGWRKALGACLSFLMVLKPRAPRAASRGSYSREMLLRACVQ